MTEPRDALALADAYSSPLLHAGERLATARSLDDVVTILRETAREVVGAEGIAIVIRDQEQRCFYAAEDAIGPLWAGSRFPMATCISGWAMLNRQTAAIPDIRLDQRIPQEAYRPTFVRSLVMAPIGRPEPIAAIGAYWSDVREHDPAVIARLEQLARLAAIAVENARLLASVRESDQQRALALTAGRMGVWSLDLISGALTTSSTCRENFGRDSDADFSYEELRAAIHPDDRDRVFAAIDNSIDKRLDYDVEYRLVTPQGETRWIGIRAQPAYAADGMPLMMTGVSVDITERKRMEHALRDSAATLEHLVEERTRQLLTAQEALRQSQKLEAMGQLTGGVAHDFNNLLFPIIGVLDLLQRNAIGSEREQRLIGNAAKSADRAKTLVQRLLAFARRQPLSPTAVDIDALVTELAALVETTIGSQIRLTLDIAGDLPAAHADQNQVEMAILNLAVNARDAMPDGGGLIIRARVDEVVPGHRSGLADGRYILLSVADDGVGMDEAVCHRAIEPFFSTKGVGKGTGLGLSMAHGLTVQLGGALTVTSAPGAGTTIDMWLPISSDRVATESARAIAAPAIRSGIALLVDDDDLVRASTADMLQELGYDVIQARSGPEALELLDRQSKIDILVTDHVMPQMTGAQLARLVRERRPGLPCLVVTGFSNLADIAPDLPRLEKPFRQSELAAHITAVLNSAGQAGRPL